MRGGTGGMELLALWASASALSCGDPGDIQVPLLSRGERTVVPVFARAPAQASATLDMRAVEGSETQACAFSTTLALQESREGVTAGDGTDDAASDADGTLVQCSVRSRADDPDAYDVVLVLGGSQLPRLAVAGSMRDEALLPVTLQLTTPAQVTVDAQCIAQPTVLRPGIVRFNIDSCAGEVDGIDCRVSVRAQFEGCAR